MDCLQSSPRNERRSWFDSVGDMRRSADTTSWRAVPSLLSLLSLRRMHSSLHRHHPRCHRPRSQSSSSMSVLSTSHPSRKLNSTPS